MDIQEFLNYHKRELTKYDEVVNTDKFGAIEVFNEQWNGAHMELCAKYDLPPLHLWETGFCKGDASDKEIRKTIRRINKECSERLNDEEDLFFFLDETLMMMMIKDAECLINEYELIFKEEYEEMRDAN
jgi:hypothetical protein